MERIWFNREDPTGRWYKSTRFRKWHEQLRYKIALWLIRSATNDSNTGWARTDTGRG